MDVRIFGTHMLLSREFWILIVKLSPDPGVTEVQETGYPELSALIVGPSCGKGMHVNTVAHCGIGTILFIVGACSVTKMADVTPTGPWSTETSTNLTVLTSTLSELSKSLIP